MFQEIRLQVYKMTFVLLLLAGLGIWQFQFVMDAIQANVFLNLTIFGTFFFGAYMAYRNVLGLGNEVHAYHALREDYEDRTNSAEQNANDPYWRYYRCKDDAVVVQSPKILEHPFQIISEELGRTNTLAMSTGTMGNLTDSVHGRLDEQKSLVSYVTGILVFLGLIGTFVGLMVTLGSVGDIIGNLDLSGGAGAEAIQGLMDGLKVPLQGMATGFSSSLFGLITSLTLGLMGRFGIQASSVLTTNFETWLAGVAQVGEGSASAQQASGGGFQERQLDLIFRVARFSLVSNARMMTTVDALTESSERMAHAQAEQAHSVGNLTQSVGQMLQSQDVINRSLIQTNEVLEDRKKLDAVVQELRDDSVAQQCAYEYVNHELQGLTDRQQAIQETAAETARRLATRDDLASLMLDVDRRLAQDTSELRKSIEGVSGMVQDIDMITKAHHTRKVQLDLENTQPLVDEIAKIIDVRERMAHDRMVQERADREREIHERMSLERAEMRREQAQSAGASVQEGYAPVISAPDALSAEKLSIAELRSRLMQDYGAVEESEAAAELRNSGPKSPNAFKRFFGGRG